MTGSEVEVSGLEVAVEATGALIVDDVSLRLASGHVMGVVGESGSGKSTLALAMLGYAKQGARISAGHVVVDGVDLLSLSERELRAVRGRKVAYVPQDPATALNPALSIRTQLTEGLGRRREVSLPALRELLRAVGLPDDDGFLKRRPRELSGGQQQRIAIAMAIAADPRLVVFDEPTTGLDVSTQARVLELVRRLCRERSMAAVYVSHDLAVVADVADTVIVMYAGQVVEAGPTRDVITRPNHPYTRALLAAVPSVGERHRLIPIRGRAPAVGDATPGCCYAPRCGFAIDACRTADPPLAATSGGRLVRCIRHEELAAKPSVTDRVPDLRAAAAGDGDFLRVSGLSAYYAGRQVLSDVSFGLARGECLAVVGESGSGKTTMSRCLIGLHGEQEGDYRFDGAAMPARAERRSASTRRQLQYVFQNPYGSLNPRRSIEQNLTAPTRDLLGMDAEASRRRAREVLDRVEIPAALLARYPGELSGGQLQRVAIARALACEPKLLLCDEVTSALDVSVQASVVELLRSLLDDGLSMIFVTHNLAVVRSIADRVIVLNGGRIVESGGTEEVLSAPTHPYTQALMTDTLDVPKSTSI